MANLAAAAELKTAKRDLDSLAEALDRLTAEAVDACQARANSSSKSGDVVL